MPERGSDTVSPMSGRLPPDDQTGEDPIGEGLGRAIRVLRTARDLGRRELAERAGLSYSYLAEIENGDKSGAQSRRKHRRRADAEPR